MDFLKAVKDLRKSRGWTQRQLAEVAGLYQGDISKIEAGANVEASTLATICSALDAEVILVPRRVAGNVRSLIARHLDPNRLAVSTNVLSVRDEMLIPDPAEDD